MYDNKSKSIAQEYSPLFGIRTTLMINRLLFGFPLSSKNNRFRKFSFFALLEFTKFAIFSFFTLIGFLAVCANTRNEHSNYGTNRPSTHSLHFLNLSSRNTFVIESYYIMMLCSCFLYLKSYKSNHVGINKICQKFVMLRRCLNTYSMKNCSANIIGRKHFTGYNLLFYIYCISMVANLILFIMCCINIDTPKDETNMLQMIAGSFKIVFLISCTYPSIAFSTDLLICYLLQAVRIEFMTWTFAMKKYKVSSNKHKNLQSKNTALSLIETVPES